VLHRGPVGPDRRDEVGDRALVLNHGRHGTSTAGGPPPIGPVVPEAPLGMLPSVSLATGPATRSAYDAPAVRRTLGSVSVPFDFDEVFDAAGRRPMVKLYNAAANQPLGDITDDQLQFLCGFTVSSSRGTEGLQDELMTHRATRGTRRSRYRRSRAF